MDELKSADLAGFLPALHGYHSVAGVYGYDDPTAAVGAADFLHHFGVAYCGSAYDHPVNACFQPGAGGFGGAYAAADLHRYVQCCDYGGNDVEVGRFAGGRAVEVYEVEARPALLLPLPGHGYGVVGEYGLLGKVALVEPDAAPAAEVYGRDDFHWWGSSALLRAVAV